MVADIVEMINNRELSASDLSDIFVALNHQKNCLGGKMWTTADIEDYISENYADGAADISKGALLDVADYIKAYSITLDDCSDEEWDCLRTGIKQADLSVKVSGIDWEIDADEDEEEPDLPTEVTIPLVDLEDYAVEEYLSDKYDFLIQGFKSIEVVS